MASTDSSIVDHGKASEMSYATKFVNDKDVIWWIDNIDHKITAEARKMLEQYSGIPPEEVVQHVYKIRDKAWNIRTYPCTGLGIWIEPMISRLAGYTTALERLKENPKSTTLLDVGTFIGQDLRRLVFDGAPSESLTGVDIASHWDVGFEMYRDASKFHAKFIECDILSPNPALAALQGTFDVIYISQVLHQWGWDGQLAAVKQLIKLSKANADAIVFGFQLGQKNGGDKVLLQTKKARSSNFLQGVDTFEELWRKAGEETGTKWVVEAELKEWEELGLDPAEGACLAPEVKFLSFVVRRLDDVK